MKVSFDFDGTLSRTDVQIYAKSLIDNGIDVWICTSRLEPSKAHREDWNDDLFLVSDKLKIPREKIIFTNLTDKSQILKDHNFIWHLDDYYIVNS